MVQKHDNRVRVSFFCHPEPGPEASSGSKDFGISVLGFKNLGFKAPPFVGGVLYYNKQKKKVIIAREFLKGEGTIVNAINKLSFP